MSDPNILSLSSSFILTYHLSDKDYQALSQKLLEIVVVCSLMLLQVNLKTLFQKAPEGGLSPSGLSI